LVEHGFTHFELRLTVHRAAVPDLSPPVDHWWADPLRLPDEALPNVMKKAIEAAFPLSTKHSVSPPTRV
jgi:A/G-specific adenine glycosylase